MHIRIEEAIDDGANAIERGGEREGEGVERDKDIVRGLAGERVSERTNERLRQNKQHPSRCV